MKKKGRACRFDVFRMCVAASLKLISCGWCMRSIVALVSHVVKTNNDLDPERPAAFRGLNLLVEWTQ